LALAPADLTPPTAQVPDAISVDAQQLAGKSDSSLIGAPITFTAAPLQGTPVVLAPSGAADAKAAAIPISSVPFEITSRASEGKRRFEIRLDPPELGRIDVRLDLARDGSVNSRLIVERAETLDLLRRDAGNLERALQSAGLQTGGSGMEFSLRDGSAQERKSPDNLTRADLLIVPDDDVAVTEAVRRAYGVLRGLGRGVDMRI
jgi:flagellar hook-length control protein FliK